jgi:hypothetical protein
LEVKRSRFYSYGELLQILLVHLLVGSRKLREMDNYREDPMVCEVVATTQRSHGEPDVEGI